MDFNAIGIPIGFILLAAIGLWLLIFAKGWWVLKIFFMTLCIYFSLAVWLSLSQLSGWPSSSELPERFLINGVAVQEPSRTDPNDKGNIYVWATELDNDFKAKKTEISSWLMPFVSKKRPSEPRAYRLPYTDEMREQMAQVSKMMKAGKPVVGERNKLTGKGDGEGGDGKGKGKGKGKGQGQGMGQGKEGQGKGKGGSMSQEQDYMFYELPPPKFPEK
jgi:hypothetical protein